VDRKQIGVSIIAVCCSRYFRQRRRGQASPLPAPGTGDLLHCAHQPSRRVGLAEGRHGHGERDGTDAVVEAIQNSNV
jgi:hypothetical protein